MVSKPAGPKQMAKKGPAVKKKPAAAKSCSGGSCSPLTSWPIMPRLPVATARYLMFWGVFCESFAPYFFIFSEASEFKRLLGS